MLARVLALPLVAAGVVSLDRPATMELVTAPLLTASKVSGGWQLAAAGAWVAQNAAEINQTIEALDHTAQVQPASLDLRAVEELDTYGAWLIESLVCRWRAHNEELRVIGLPER